MVAPAKLLLLLLLLLVMPLAVLEIREIEGSRFGGTVGLFGGIGGGIPRPTLAPGFIRVPPAGDKVAPTKDADGDGDVAFVVPRRNVADWDG